MTKPKHKVVVLSISTPLLVGIYVDDILIDSYSKDGLTSDLLPEIFEDIMARYHIDTVLYISGPGSYMAIKVCYIFLTTLSIIKDFELLSCSGFEFNRSSAIKAINDRYFYKIGDDIVLKKLEQTDEIYPFALPNSLEHIKSSTDTKPNFVLPVI